MTDATHRVDLDSAERIVRALVGVADVRVEGAADGRIACVRVAPDPGVAQRDVALNVASALRATLGVSLPLDAVLLGPVANGHGNGHGAGNGGTVTYGAAAANGSHAAVPKVPGPSTNGARPPAEASRVRLETAELARKDGRVRCRIALLAAGERWASTADAPDLPGEDLRLAARVTADALRAARAAADPIQVDDAILTHVAGRPHAVVALRIWTADHGRAAYGVEPITATIERAAALAVIRAAQSDSL